jgi:putative solute:sodium symporter small subunit
LPRRRGFVAIYNNLTGGAGVRDAVLRRSMAGVIPLWPKVVFGLAKQQCSFHLDSEKQHDGVRVQLGDMEERRRACLFNVHPCAGTARPARNAQEGTVTNTNEQAHWRRTSNLMFTHLAIWFFFGYVIHMFVHVLNKVTIPVLGFPLGFYMAAQGSLIVFVVMLFLFAKQQDRIDREHGVAEDD